MKRWRAGSKTLRVRDRPERILTASPKSSYSSAPLTIKNPLLNKRSQTEVIFDGVDNSDNLDNPATRRRASLATQQKLGLWTKRRTGFGFGDCADSSAVGKNLAGADSAGPSVRLTHTQPNAVDYGRIEYKL